MPKLWKALLVRNTTNDSKPQNKMLLRAEIKIENNAYSIIIRAYSIITSARIKDSWSTSWLNVKNLFRCDRNVMTYKIMNRLCPEGLWDKYQPRSFHSTYNTRQCEDLQIPRYKTEFAKRLSLCSSQNLE